MGFQRWYVVFLHIDNHGELAEIRYTRLLNDLHLLNSVMNLATWLTQSTDHLRVLMQ
jgi:hypothetical protein